VAATVSHTFTAFGELLELYKRMLELYGYTSRVMELENALHCVHSAKKGEELEAAWQSASLVAGGAASDASAAGAESIAFGAVAASASAAAAAGAAASGAIGANAGVHAASAVEGGAIVFRQTDIATPTGTSLVEAVNMIVQPGENLLVTGPSGSGKTSLIRVLGGLWPARAGTVTMPTAADKDAPFYKTVFLVPQAPYSVLGSLADQLTYPELVRGGVLLTSAAFGV
jgi:ABC-type multidrug transport system fused ATPase/permease subunit